MASDRQLFLLYELERSLWAVAFWLYRDHIFVQSSGGMGKGEKAVCEACKGCDGCEFSAESGSFVLF